MKKCGRVRKLIGKIGSKVNKEEFAVAEAGVTGGLCMFGLVTQNYVLVGATFGKLIADASLTHKIYTTYKWAEFAGVESDLEARTWLQTLLYNTCKRIGKDCYKNYYWP